ncbi:hypothetical protein Slin14017_G126890 [Septoria linicola]|nr:hypothetical protein Slin14017_G126890 [Septoria linicola]
MPPPLCTLDGKRYLQATVYTPTQQPRSRKLPKMSLKLPNVEEKKSREALLLLIDAPWTPGGGKRPKEDISSAAYPWHTTQAQCHFLSAAPRSHWFAILAPSMSSARHSLNRHQETRMPVDDLGRGN